MSIVTLVSGGLDSTVMALLIKEERLTQYPLFINYGQLNHSNEIRACMNLFAVHGLPPPKVIDITSWGRTIGSGLTDNRMRIFEDAFLPGRNALLLLIGASYAYRVGANAIAIGLLHDETSIFPDQTREFCDASEAYLSMVLDRRISVLTPLKEFFKSNVVSVAKTRGITGTYSCHAGTPEPCGKCVSCREYVGIEV